MWASAGGNAGGTARSAAVSRKASESHSKYTLCAAVGGGGGGSREKPARRSRPCSCRRRCSRRARVRGLPSPGGPVARQPFGAAAACHIVRPWSSASAYCAAKALERAGAQTHLTGATSRQRHGGEPCALPLTEARHWVVLSQRWALYII